jgi:glycogen debranching enzyme
MYRPSSPFLRELANRIQIKRVPFSDRGSRLLVYQDDRNPHSLYMKLAERLTSLTPGLSVYRTRPPFIPSLRLVDGDGRPLEFSLTTYPHALVCETKIGEFIFAFQEDQTISIGLPHGIPSGVYFQVVPDLARPDSTGGEFKMVRNCAYSTNGTIQLNQIDRDQVAYAVTLVVSGDSDTAITLQVKAGYDLTRAVRPFREVLANAEDRWHRWFAAVPEVAASYRSHYYYAWWVLANNILAPHGLFRRPCVVPSKAHYVGAWQWDNYFHAMALAHVDSKLAGDQILFMLDHQLSDGMLPDAVYDEGAITYLETPVPGPVTKPPLDAWAAMLIYARTGDDQLLRTVYEPLVRWNGWWFSMNDDDADGLAQYVHPFSSGLDDSPLWDGGMPVEAVDLNTYLCIQMESLSAMARIIGRNREATMWRTRADSIARRMIDDFYEPSTGLFWSYHNDQPIRILTPFSLYPLWTGRMPAAINERLVAHLHNPQTFWAKHPLPTVATSDPFFNPNRMWRGPVWININMIFVDALTRTGYHAQARTLAERTLELVMLHNDIYEYYNPITGDPPATAAPTFGWSAACFIELAVRLSKGEL